jgi:endonuclease/exonuclease/phosphatase family metal-dependent hydrolase
MWIRPAALALALSTFAAPGVAAAADVPVAGRLLRLDAGPAGPDARRARLVLQDPAIARPFPDFAAAGATLRLHGGAGAGQCFVVADLDAAGWRPIGGDGARHGWRWRDPTHARAGVSRVVVRPGRILLVARGAAFPCALEAAQREPVTVTLAAQDARWCAAFGGEVAANAPGRFLARRAPPPAACPARRVTLANLNILLGIFCPDDTVQCRFEERLDLLFQWIEDAGCPDAVTLQEVTLPQSPILLERVPSLCAGAYQALYVGENLFDDELHLVRHPVTVVEAGRLYRNFRTSLFTRLDHPLGPLDVFSTHLAASGDGAQRGCGDDCPAECVAAGASTVRQCQGVQMAALVAARHDVATPALVTGDFNEPPQSFVWRQLVERGWPDVYLAAGRPECDPATGVGCTAGRFDAGLADLESPASGELERIDYVFLVPPAAGPCAIDAAFTRIFADEPNPFAPACGPAPDPPCWPSDHEGMQVGLDCR